MIGAPFDIAVPDNRSFWDMVKDAGRAFINHIKEDPWQFAGEVAIGIPAGLVVGLACSTGIGCVILAGNAAAAAGAAYGYGVDVAQGEHGFDLGEFAKETAIGGLIGGITAGIGYGIGRGLSKLFRKIKLPTSCHSFAAGTLVLMADGTTKRVEDIKVGDLVVATDPQTGLSISKPVTLLHFNQDQDLAEVTGYDKATGATSILKTTWHHPFWSATDDAWVDAADLKPAHGCATTKARKPSSSSPSAPGPACSKCTTSPSPTSTPTMWSRASRPSWRTTATSA